MDIIEEVKKTIEVYALFDKGDRVVVGVSGGADSVFLLHALKKLSEYFSLTLCVAHLNHLLRGSEAEEDEEFVKNIAKEAHLPFFVRRVPTKLFASLFKMSLQDAARLFRYTFFEEVAAEFCAEKIALGHTLSDLSETVLMHVVKGCGIKGLVGILPKRKENLTWIVRPLIHLNFSDIREYMKRKSIPYREDSSNIKCIYLRNKIRHKVLPLLKECNPKVEEALFKLSQIAAAYCSYIEEDVKNFIERAKIKENGREAIFDTTILSSLHPTLLSEIVRELLFLSFKKPPSQTHINAMMNLIRKSKNSQIHLGEKIKVKKEYGKIRIWKGGLEEKKKYKIPLKIGEKTVIDGVGECLVQIENIAPKKDDKFFAAFDLAKIKPPLYIRSREEGDYFLPLNFSGKKTLKKFFIDSKIPKEERERIPLLVDAEKILWVIGYRKDRRAIPTAQTKNFLYVEFSPLT